MGLIVVGSGHAVDTGDAFGNDGRSRQPCLLIGRVVEQ